MSDEIKCDGRRSGGACWGEVRCYNCDGDWFCEGHWEAREGQGYLAEPPRIHGPRVTDEQGRSCVRRYCQPCWGKLERFGDYEDVYCEAHHPVDGVYQQVRAETAREVEGNIMAELTALKAKLLGAVAVIDCAQGKVKP